MPARKVRLQSFPSEQLRGRSFVAPNGTEEPYFTGDYTAAPDLLCPQCDRVLVRGVPAALLVKLLFQCPHCSAFSEVHSSVAQSVSAAC